LFSGKPVFDGEAVNSPKFTHIVGHQNRSQAQLEFSRDLDRGFFDDMSSTEQKLLQRGWNYRIPNFSRRLKYASGSIE